MSWSIQLTTKNITVFEYCNKMASQGNDDDYQTCIVSGLEDAVKLVKGIGGKCYGYVVDLASREDIYRVAKKVEDEVGRVRK